MSTASPLLAVGVATDVGAVRKHNEDAARAEGSVFVVADGMGGHAAGEVASGIAADTMVELSARPDLRADDIVGQVGEANRRILDSAEKHPEQAGMGTTVTGLAAVSADGDWHWVVFNLGDSRVYRYVDGELTQVTADHSEVWELVERGALSPEQAQRHPGRNIVTRSLGRDPMGMVDTWELAPEAGDVFLVCSDGLSNELSSEQIRAVLAERTDAQSAADELVRQAVAAGGRDNVTAIVVANQAD